MNDEINQHIMKENGSKYRLLFEVKLLRKVLKINTLWGTLCQRLTYEEWINPFPHSKYHVCWCSLRHQYITHDIDYVE